MFKRAIVAMILVALPVAAASGCAPATVEPPLSTALPPATVTKALTSLPEMGTATQFPSSAPPPTATW